MRLRHKKPLNSYVSQVNFDSSQILDEDFEKNAYAGKKSKVFKHRPTNDNLQRYSLLLCDFVQAINSDYRQHIEKFGDKKGIQGPPVVKETNSEINKPKKSLLELPLQKNIEVVSKQQQKSNLQQKNKQLEEKEIKKIKAIKQDIKKRKQSKQLPKPVTKQQPLPKNTPRQEIDLTSQDNVHTVPNNVPPPAYNPINPLMFQNGFLGMNNINPALFQSLQYQMPMYQNILSEQMKQNPNMMMYNQPYLQNLIAMLNFQNIPNNYIPFSKLPFYQSKVPEKISQTKKPEQVVQENVKQIQKQEDKTIGQGFFNKRSCAHLAIAYHIHCANLKSTGKLGTQNGKKGENTQNLQELDPTYPAKKIRAKNNSNRSGNAHDQTNHLLK